MQIPQVIDDSAQAPHENRVNERGAALITVLLFSMLLLTAGGALIMTTALSATNAVDATAETQAYYAAEAGMQATMAVLRGNVAPNPLFDTSSPTAAANKISFRKAVTLSTSNVSGDAAGEARLSRWLSYNGLTTASRVQLSSPYSFFTGMAYETKVEDPDNTAVGSYSTLGSFGAATPSATPQFTFGLPGNRVTVTYTSQASSSISASGLTLGTFSTSSITGTPPFIGAEATFTITIRQVAANGTFVDVPVTCTLAYVSATNSVTVTFNGPSTTTNYVLGTTYAHSASISISSNSSTSIPVTVTPPEPSRVRVTVTGWGPRGAKKKMQMLVSRANFDFTANATITIRGADPTPSGVPMTTFTVGSSQPYSYSGYDNSGGAPLPAFVVTNDLDKTLVDLHVTGQITGSPSAARKAPLSELPLFLQTADRAREAVATLRELAQSQYWPVGVMDTDHDRYFPSGTTPDTFGSATTPLMTFVDGDCALPPGGGAGLLVVTGILDMRGSADFKGLVLVLGAGQVLRNGGGSDTTLGAMDIARFGPTGDFLPPSFDSNGGGASAINYDSKWLERALMSAGPGVRGVVEY